MLYREMHESPDLDYRHYMLRVAQGYCIDSLKNPLAPVRGINRSWSRSYCRSCSNISPYKDSRTSKTCARCGAGCCTRHSKKLSAPNVPNS